MEYEYFISYTESVYQIRYLSEVPLKIGDIISTEGYSYKINYIFDGDNLICDRLN